MIKFVEHRVADPRILRLIQKWLKAGVMEEGKWSEPKTGSPQGSVISPLAGEHLPASTFRSLGERLAQEVAQGEVVVIRYADDSLAGIPVSDGCGSFPGEFTGATGQFGLELHPDKTRRIEFGQVCRREPEDREGKGNPRRSIFWASRTSAGRTAWGEFQVRRRRSASACGPSCEQSSRSSASACMIPCPNRPMAPVGRAGPLQLLRGTRKQR